MTTATAKTTTRNTAKGAAKGTAKKGSTAKTATVQSTVPAQDTTPVENVVMQALRTRLAKLQALELTNQSDALRSVINKTSTALLDKAQEKLTQTNFDAIAARIAQCDDKGKGLEQVKTIEKIVRFAGAVAIDSEKSLCNYLKVSALTTLQNDGSVSVREMVCALSRVARQNADIFAVREGFKNLANYSMGTGNSQASQARQVFNVFGFYDGFVKGGKNNAPVLTPYGEGVLRGLVFAKG